jgi:hypothetical protein
MGIADELEKLEQLRTRGTLTDAEFAQAKNLLLAAPLEGVDPQLGTLLHDQMADVQYQNELARIDREWESQRRQFQIVNRYGAVYMPTVGMGTGMVMFGGILGLLWTYVAFVITSQAPDFEPFQIARIIFPGIGIVFTMTTVGRGIYCCVQALRYQDAFAAYQANRRRSTSGLIFEAGATSTDG